MAAHHRHQRVAHNSGSRAGPSYAAALLVLLLPCGLAERRGLRQDDAANNQQLPRLVIGRVKATVVNTYAWSIQRQATASGIALTADGVSRKQLGHTLSYTRSLASTAYKLEGVASITNPSGQGSVTLLSVGIVLGSRVMRVECEGTALPDSPHELPPAGVLECVWAQTWDAHPGIDSVSGYVETSFGRAPAAEGAVPFSFRDCGKPAADGSASPCALVERGACASVTDGSYIVSKYKDKLGESLTGTVTRGGSSSRLFETSPPIEDSRLGPARVEPTIPVGAGGPSQPAAVRPAEDTPPGWRPKMPDSSWWTRRLHRQQQQQQPSPALTDLAAQLDASFKWPAPTIAGDRPPLGLLGRPQGTAAERRICDSRSFGYSMVFGPLLPAACGTFEVQNVAAALPTDGLSAAVTHSTYFHLQVLCPAKTEAGAARSG